MKNLKRFGSPNDRLQERLKQEAKRDLSPLAADEKLLNVRQAAARLNISHHTVRQWALDDKMIYRRIGGLMMMIPESEVERLRNQLGN
jgi:excisionase family DNA binding protein